MWFVGLTASLEYLFSTFASLRSHLLLFRISENDLHCPVSNVAHRREFLVVTNKTNGVLWFYGWWPNNRPFTKIVVLAMERTKLKEKHLKAKIVTQVCLALVYFIPWWNVSFSISFLYWHLHFQMTIRFLKVVKKKRNKCLVSLPTLKKCL